MIKYLFVFFLLVGVLTACSPRQEHIAVREETQTIQDTREVASPQQEDEACLETIYVYVCGCVNNPGVYALPNGSRICDALAMAGGVDDYAKPEALHQAQPVTDGQTIYVPSKEEVVAAPDSQDDLININEAGKELLMTLPGIGASKADLIINYRNEHGSFQKIEELMDIPGIKEGLFEKIKDSIKVS